MAKTGLKHPVVAKLGENGTYTEGKVIGRAISEDISISVSDVKLYADDVVAESDRSFGGGTIKIGIDDLSLEDTAFILGHTLTGEEGKDKELIANTADLSPYLGHGFYGGRMHRNVKSYRAVWLLKVQFGEPNDTAASKAENTEFKTTEIEGTIMQNDNGVWKEEIIVKTEPEAVEWLNKKAGIAAEAPINLKMKK